MVLKTERLVLRELILADAALILELLNEQAFIEFIGDKGVRDLAGAENYLREGPLASYAKHGFGLWCVTLKDGTPLGMCGLLKRDFLNHPDLGYALLARFTGRGYAHEAAAAVMQHARGHLKLTNLHAITAIGNPASIKLLGKLGFAFVEFIQQPGYEEPSRLFTWQAEASPVVPREP
jgi:ribosomal-protein-alanine N-acetyltransferase